MKLYEINNKKKYDFSCIYLWTNLVNGKKYVGQTNCFKNRMAQYRNGSFNVRMRKAIEEYGIENFEITILERDVAKESLDEREQYWLDYYKSYDEQYGYNICQFAGSTRGYKLTPEQCHALSIRVSGEGNGMYGKKHTKEWCKEHSDWLKDKWANNEEYREFWSDKMSGKNNYFYGKRFYGDTNGHAKTIRCVELDKIYTTVKEAAEECGMSRQNISHALNGRQKTAGGYHWEYV